ncbi:MAG: DUF4290 domain-containing protein [Bacteroidales bacterium]|nr:DUF4290 domain-containing protein [Bacteroidales bacterium]
MIEYNTKRNKLVIKEYGRNVQKMIEDCMAIEDREKRNETARAIVRVMDQLNEVKDPANVGKRESADYWHKLWDHLFIMSDYALEIDSPFPKPVPETKEKEVVKPEYNKHHIRLRTYGRNMENVIKMVATYPEDVRNVLVRPLANHLKMMYLTYNRDSVNDALIAHQINELSDGLLTVPEDFTFATTNALLHTANSNASFYVTPAKKKKKKKNKKKKTGPINL